MRTTASTAAPPTVAPVIENARPRLQRSFRIGGPTWTAPLGNPTTTVRPDSGSRVRWEKTADEPWAAARSHARFEPCGPVKQPTPLTDAGADTVTAAPSIGTNHSVPMAFQYSSSWSLNALRTPRTRYAMVYVWAPVIVRLGSPIRMWLCPDWVDTCNSAGVPGDAVTATSLTGSRRS